MRAHSFFLASIVIAISISAPGCYTQVKTNGWGPSEARPVPSETLPSPPPVVIRAPEIDDVLGGEYIGTIQFDFDAGGADERTYSGDISFRFQDGMYRCESKVIVERGRFKDHGKEIVFDPPLPLPTAERPQHWVATGTSGIARFAVEHSDGTWRLTSRDESQNRTCEIALHRLFAQR
jgi:hypothetical protein